MRIVPAVTVLCAALAAAGTALGAPAQRAAETRVTVKVTDKQLVVSRPHLDAGPTTFVVVNGGTTVHALSIVGPGLPHAKTAKVASGKTGTLSVTLRKGAYMLEDPLARNPQNATRWIVVSPAVQVTATGNGSVVVPITTTTGMDCD